uniref:rRNA N-glycosylase n=1 Tax=Arundo donax TaxID=35708 RepID=A0A0A9EMA5_ARUDO
MARVPLVVEVDFVVAADNYNSNINNLRATLADHPDPEDVDGHPVLTKQLFPQEPARWIHINLSSGEHKASILAVRDDNVYLIGFKAQSGTWFEFGFEGKSMRMITGSTFLECGPDYRSLLGGSSSKEVRANLVKLQLGKSVAEDAVVKLSGYAQPKPPPGAPDEATKLGLARLILMICEDDLHL